MLVVNANDEGDVVDAGDACDSGDVGDAGDAGDAVDALLSWPCSPVDCHEGILHGEEELETVHEEKEKDHFCSTWPQSPNPALHLKLKHFSYLAPPVWRAPPLTYHSPPLYPPPPPPRQTPQHLHISERSTSAFQHDCTKAQDNIDVLADNGSFGSNGQT